MMFSAGSERILRPTASISTSSRVAPSAAVWGRSISGFTARACLTKIEMCHTFSSMDTP